MVSPRLDFTTKDAHDASEKMTVLLCVRPKKSRQAEACLDFAD
jgi:hypothetical protein